MKLSFLKSIERFALTRGGTILDSDTSLTALMQRNGMLALGAGDEDDWDFEPEDFDLDAAPASTFIVDYVARQISRIPQYGDGARWRIASHLDMFGDALDCTGKLTDEQRQAIDNFVSTYEVKND